MGPAFAVSVAPKAITDRAKTEAIAVIEIILLTGMSTLNMRIGGYEIDYIKSHCGYRDWTNDDALAHFI
jgi:hypothetical protein